MSTVIEFTSYSPQEIMVKTQFNKTFVMDIIQDKENQFHSEILEEDTSLLHNNISTSSTSCMCFEDTIKWINNLYKITEVCHIGASELISVNDTQQIINNLKINITIKKC